MVICPSEFSARELDLQQSPDLSPGIEIIAPSMVDYSIAFLFSIPN